MTYLTFGEKKHSYKKVISKKDTKDIFHDALYKDYIGNKMQHIWISYIDEMKLCKCINAHVSTPTD